MCVRGGKVFAYPRFPLQKGGRRTFVRKTQNGAPTHLSYSEREAGAPIGEILGGEEAGRLGNAAETRSMLYVANRH